MARPRRGLPWCERLGDPHHGTFYAFWYDAKARQTRRRSLRTSDELLAKTRFAEFLEEAEELRQEDLGELTVEKALDDYYAEHVVPNTAAPRRQMDAIRNLNDFFGNRLLESVDIPLSRAYTKARLTGTIGGRRKMASSKTLANEGKKAREKKQANPNPRSARAKPATVRRELNVLVAAANHALKWKRTTANVSVELPQEARLGVDDEAPYLTVEEVKKLIEAATGELRLFIELAYLTGARRGSIQELKRGQVKLPQKRILLQPPGKRATKKRQPIVPILKAMEAPLKKLMETGGSERLFSTPDFYKPYVALAKACGIEKGRAHPHVLRHSRATHLLQDGKSLYDVAKLLGDTVRTVEAVYGHHSHEHLAGALED